MDFDHSRWQTRLEELCRAHEVPGATLAFALGGQVHEIAVGVLDKASGAPMTTGAMFQIGSITKVFTATLVMQLVSEGLVDLDTPVRDVLPEFSPADAEAGRTITVRNLLSHTSGMENGTFPDVGSDDDCLERYLTAAAGLGQLHPVGALGAYCHVGYLIAGRVVEKLTGQVWESAVRERLLDPLGLHQTAARADLADPALRVPGHRAAGTPLRWDTPRVMGPGSGLCATAGDLVRFAAAHQSDDSVLPPALTKAMREPQAPVPCAWSGGHRGLGWRLYPGDQGLSYGHGGELPGLLTYLHVVEDPALAVALCSNGGDAMALRADVHQDLAALAGQTVPRFTAPDSPPDVDVTPYLGDYRCTPAEATLEQDATGIWLKPRFGGGANGLMPRETRLVPVTDTLFAGYESDGRYPIPVTLHTLPDGSRYLYARERMLRRVNSPFTAPIGSPVEGT